jgi:hypothetical protein
MEGALLATNYHELTRKMIKSICDIHGIRGKSCRYVMLLRLVMVCREASPGTMHGR